MSSYVSVALPIPHRDPFTYKFTGSTSESLVGFRVKVPFRNKTALGYIVQDNLNQADIPHKDIKEIDAILDTQPVIIPSLYDASQWISSYYLCSWGEAIDQMIPRYLKTHTTDFSSIALRKSKNASTGKTYHEERIHHRLNSEQNAAVTALTHALDTNEYHEFLIKGITGSGKTEVYLRAIEHALHRGKSSLCLFPEIALTTHLETVFRAYFADSVAVIHSKLTERERFLLWRSIYNGEKRIVIGPRSALFSPLKDLGLIILDEEHENTYKQSDTPRYDARTVARRIAQYTHAALVFGGATPSLELLYRAHGPEVNTLHLTHRIEKKPLPEIHIVNMKNELHKGKGILISQMLKSTIERTLTEKGGILLFLNRRGFATFVHCPHCGTTITCTKCKVALTYHQSRHQLLCHYCDSHMKVPDTCPQCTHRTLWFGGAGTERIESTIAKLFPHARIERLDTDRIKKKGEQEDILNRFKRNEIDILIGTQIITKGFDFPHVTLVGVINADTALALPDFRANERTFHLLTQVAGRAGRGEKPGTVIIQTYAPANDAIISAVSHNPDQFYAKEIIKRKELLYPPFTRLVNIIVRSKIEHDVHTSCESLAVIFQHHPHPDLLDVLGPSPLPFAYINGYHRWHIMLKMGLVMDHATYIRKILEQWKPSHTVQMAIDVDPVSIL